MWQYNYSDELMHYGTLGMRWGVRRYQNKDGSLTLIGKRKYGTKANFEKVQAAKRSVTAAKVKSKASKANQRTQAEIDKYRKKAGEVKSKNTTASTKSTTKSLRDMSNQEISDAIHRRRLENDYEVMFPKKISRGRAIFNTVKDDMIIPAATDIGKQYVKSYIAKTVNNLGNLEGEYKVYANNQKKK